LSQLIGIGFAQLLGDALVVVITCIVTAECERGSVGAWAKQELFVCTGLLLVAAMYAS
jgi:hypothetical protein